jgi:hypothetical protein
MYRGMCQGRGLLTLQGTLAVERSTATEIVGHLRSLDEPLNAAMAAVEKIQNIEQRRTLRRALASIVGAVYTDLLVPIGKDFPDLLPDKDDLDVTS